MNVVEKKDARVKSHEKYPKQKGTKVGKKGHTYLSMYNELRTTEWNISAKHQKITRHETRERVALYRYCRD